MYKLKLPLLMALAVIVCGGVVGYVEVQRDKEHNVLTDFFREPANDCLVADRRSGRGNSCD